MPSPDLSTADAAEPVRRLVNPYPRRDYVRPTSRYIPGVTAEVGDRSPSPPRSRGQGA